jgi:hypothetical protein
MTPGGHRVYVLSRITDDRAIDGGPSGRRHFPSRCLLDHRIGYRPRMQSGAQDGGGVGACGLATTADAGMCLGVKAMAGASAAAARTPAKATAVTFVHLNIFLSSVCRLHRKPTVMVASSVQVVMPVGRGCRGVRSSKRPETFRNVVKSPETRARQASPRSGNGGDAVFAAVTFEAGGPITSVAAIIEQDGGLGFAARCCRRPMGSSVVTLTIVSHRAPLVPALSRDRSKLRAWNGPGSRPGQVSNGPKQTSESEN